MQKEEKYRLCGGTFFVLLSDARKPLLSKAENYKGKKSGITETELLLSLARIVIPDIPEPMSSELKSLRDSTNDFKSCKNWGGGFFRLGDKSVKKSFDERLKNNYSESLTAISKLVDKYIDAGTSTKKDEYLVKALVEVIIADDKILPEQLLYIQANGQPIEKKMLSSISEICLQSFLLGIWHFVLTAVDNNTIGRDTYNAWCPPHSDSKGSKREYVAAIGENSNLNIHLSYYENDHLCDESSDDVNETENTAETIETEIVDEVKNDDTTARYIDNSVMVNIGNGLQIKENQGTLNIVLGK